MAPTRRGLAISLALAGSVVACASWAAGPVGLAGEQGFGYNQAVAVAAGMALLAAAGLVALRGPAVLIAFGVALLLSVGTLYVQYRELGALYPGIDSAELVEGGQLGRHDQTLSGDIGDPWRFRLLAEWVAEGALVATEELGVTRPVLVGFLGLRLAQNIAIFALAWLLYRRLGASRFVAALGLALVAWAMTHALYHSALSYDTYMEVALFLVAAHLVLSRRYAWLVPLTAIAVLNRETSALMAAMPLAMVALGGERGAGARRALASGLAALAGAAVAFALVRTAVGPAPLIEADGHGPGIELIEYNFGRAVTWGNLFETVTVLPLLALAALPRWPLELKALGLAVAPVWIGAHFVLAVAAETRLFLVPYVLVLVPGVLAALRERDPPESVRTAPRSTIFTAA
jgi:hypothetical protein